MLKAYVGKFGVGPGWLFLTGKKDDVKALTRKLGLSHASDAFSKDGHANSLMLGNDPNGQWMRTRPGLRATTKSWTRCGQRAT